MKYAEMYVPAATHDKSLNPLRLIPIWWMSARPKTLWAAIAPVVLGGGIAFQSGSRDYFLFSIILTTALLIQIATNLANDLIDARKGTDTALRIGPRRAVQSGLLSEEAVKRGLIATLFVATLLGFYLVLEGGLPVLCIGLAALLCTIWYSAGPAALSYSGLADIFVLAFFGPIAVAGTAYLLVGSWSADAVLLGLTPGFISVAVLVANNLRDFWTDSVANKKTLVVRFGLVFGKLEYSICLLLACFVPLYCYNGPGIGPLLGCITIFAVIPLLMQLWKAQSALEFMPILPQTAKLLVLYSGLFCIGLFLPW